MEWIKGGVPKQAVAWLVVAGAALVLISAGLWWTKVYQNPERVYWDMLSNSLQTASVTRTLQQQSTQSSLDQTIVLNFTPRTAAYSVTSLKQGGNTIKTESVGVPGTDYIRYTAIASDQKGANNQPLNFKGVLNKWAKNDMPDSSNTGQTQTPLLTEVMLGVAGGNLIPQANLAAKDRDDLIKVLKASVVYDTDFTSVKKQLVRGRPVYTYTTNVQAVAYVGFEKAFAKKVGLHVLDNVQPDDYQGQAPTKVELQVDAWSHQLLAVDYPGQGRHEAYGSYGVAHPITVPTANLSGAELQQLVNGVK